jgi:hypothetical protein
MVWIVAKSCTTKRMAESLSTTGCLPPINWFFGFGNILSLHPLTVLYVQARVLQLFRMTLLERA